MEDRAPECELCEAARFTHWYSEDDICWVADCEACLVPMVVWKRHGIEPSAEDRSHMMERLADAAGVRWPDGDPWQADDDMRTIPDHFHVHARDTNWFAHRSGRRLSRFTGVGTARIER